MSTHYFSNILLWRHAQAIDLAEFDDIDIARPLTKKGVKQAEKMAAWLRANMPKDTLVMSSNALRAKQTAQALSNDYVVFSSLNPNASVSTVLETISTLPADLHCTNLLLVGHQPWIGLLAAQLLNYPNVLPNNAREIGIKKGAIWWFKQTATEHKTPYQLLCVKPPGML